MKNKRKKNLALCLLFGALSLGPSTLLAFGLDVSGALDPVKDIADVGATGEYDKAISQAGIGIAGHSISLAIHTPLCLTTPPNVISCAKIGIDIVAIIKLSENLKKTTKSRNTISSVDSGSDGSDGSDSLSYILRNSGLCLDQSSGCTQDKADIAISKTPIGQALKNGNVKKILEASKDSQNKAKKLIADLKAKGLKIDEKNDTLTDPSGKKHSYSALTEQALSAPLTGLSKDIASKISSLDFSAKGQRKRGLASTKVGAGGGGSYSSTGSRFNSNKKRRKKRFKKSKKKKEDFLAALAGKNGFQGVGVAGDDIFKMLQRRYNKKKKSREFIFR